MRISRLMLTFPLLALLAACSSPTGTPPATSAGPTVDLGQIVEATLAAMTAQATAATRSATATALLATPNSSSGGAISGALKYPADRLPPMYVVAYRVDSQSYQYVVTNAGQATYKIADLPPGTYHVIAYTIGGDGFPAGIAGGFTQAVPCGLATECANHALIDVAVTAGKTAAGVNAYDWYAPPGTFPPFPAQASLATATSSIPTGSVAGDLSYPSSFIPPERVVAFQVGSPSYYFVDTQAGQSHYQIDGLPPGVYHVVAYAGTGGLAGGYSEMVPCGLKVGCTDHTLIDVTVVSGQITSGADPKDFYAEPGSFPPPPVP